MNRTTRNSRTADQSRRPPAVVARCSRSVRGLVASALLAAGLPTLGCADGPFGNLNAYNPLIRRQWTADERLGTTYYQQAQRLQSLESRASGMDADQRKRVADEMTQVVRTEDNPLLRAQAVRVLGEIEDPAATLGLDMATTDKAPEVRLAACRVLGEKRNRASLRSLARMLASDQNVDVRIAAARELGNYRDPEAYRALGEALNDTDPAMQHRALESLRRASGRDFGNDLAAWRQFIDTGQAEEPPQSWVSRLTSWF